MLSCAGGPLKATSTQQVRSEQNYGQVVLGALTLNGNRGKRGKGKAINSFKQFSESRYRQSIYEYVNEIIIDDETIHGKAKYDNAYQHLADQLKCSKSKIRDIYKREEKSRNV